MCMSPKMKPGGRISVTLSFQDGQTVNTSFPVPSATAKPRDRRSCQVVPAATNPAACALVGRE
jgi:hypothetical protein